MLLLVWLGLFLVGFFIGFRKLVLLVVGWWFLGLVCYWSELDGILFGKCWWCCGCFFLVCWFVVLGNCVVLIVVGISVYLVVGCLVWWVGVLICWVLVRVLGWCWWGVFRGIVDLDWFCGLVWYCCVWWFGLGWCCGVWWCFLVGGLVFGFVFCWMDIRFVFGVYCDSFGWWFWCWLRWCLVRFGFVIYWFWCVRCGGFYLLGGRWWLVCCCWLGSVCWCCCGWGCLVNVVDWWRCSGGWWIGCGCFGLLRCSWCLGVGCWSSWLVVIGWKLVEWMNVWWFWKIGSVVRWWCVICCVGCLIVYWCWVWLVVCWLGVWWWLVCVGWGNVGGMLFVVGLVW